MRHYCLMAFAAAACVGGSAAMASEISGEYLEARSCEVYTGPCFGNAEIGLAGNEAVLAWKVDEGSWNGVSLKGLGAALIVNAENTLGTDGIFEQDCGKLKSVLVVDESATADQREALELFVRDSARELAANIVRVDAAPIQLSNDHLSGESKFTAGKLAQIETRGLRKGDCVCSNEAIFYLPLTDVENYSPAYTQMFSYSGDGLDNTWTIRSTRSAFQATFRR